ncbi:hypothetical protein VTN77DRAFT_964 [Rasamsonia byssochlamydoides]|uniref:uncharacterized protein n=1 Tax=Rasamsonia byssochlamydoides TaxID=89139 RepID=UPI00374423EF
MVVESSRQIILACAFHMKMYWKPSAKTGHQDAEPQMSQQGAHAEGLEDPQTDQAPGRELVRTKDRCRAEFIGRDPTDEGLDTDDGPGDTKCCKDRSGPVTSRLMIFCFALAITTAVCLSAILSTAALPTTDAHVKLLLLDGGSMTASAHKVHESTKPEPFRMYDWTFYIYNEAKDRRILWNLGMGSNNEEYTFIVNVVWDEVNPTGPRESIPEQLRRRVNITADQVDSVVFSPTATRILTTVGPFETRSQTRRAFFGPGTIECCSPGHLVDQSFQWDGRFFDPTNATERWETLQGPWVKFGSFEKTMDFFGDGSFWVIQAPGHMPGNLCAFARIEDTHSRALLDGLRDFAIFELPDGSQSYLQADIPAARDTVARIRTIEKDLGVHIALAHDTSWMLEEANQTLLSLLDDQFRAALRTNLRHGEAL